MNSLVPPKGVIIKSDEISYLYVEPGSNRGMTSGEDEQSTVSVNLSSLSENRASEGWTSFDLFWSATK